MSVVLTDMQWPLRSTHGCSVVVVVVRTMVMAKNEREW